MLTHAMIQEQAQQAGQKSRSKTRPARALAQEDSNLKLKRYLGSQKMQNLEANRTIGSGLSMLSSGSEQKSGINQLHDQGERSSHSQAADGLTEIFQPSRGQTPAPTYPAPAPASPVPEPAYPTPAPITPEPEYPGPEPATKPEDTPEITSETVATQPGDRSRTTIGVGEEVNLTHKKRKVKWTTTAGTLSAKTGQTIKFTAPDTAQKVTITGRGATITFDVIAPNDVHMDRVTNTGVTHTKDRPDSGINTEIYLLPDTVNFYNVLYHEVDVGAAADGVYKPFNGFSHDPHPATISLSKTVVSKKGTKTNGADCIYSGDPGTASPFAPGSIRYDIPYEYKVGGGSFFKFATVIQISTLDQDGSKLNSSKAAASGDTTVASASDAIAACPV